MNSTAVHYNCLSSSIMTLTLQVWPSHTASFQKALPNLCWRLDSLSITTVRFSVRVWPKNCISFSQIVILETISPLMWHGPFWLSRSSPVASPDTSASIHPPSTEPALDLILDYLLLIEIQATFHRQGLNIRERQTFVSVLHLLWFFSTLVQAYSFNFNLTL